jgi:hypothetical protein
MMATTSETVETLEEVIEMMDEIALKLRGLHNERIRAYCLADFEGRNSREGWMGTFVRDILEEELETARHSDDED